MNTPKINVESSLIDLNSTGCDWILLKKTENELLEDFAVVKDIGILVQSIDKESMHASLLALDFKEIPHPQRLETRLYGVDEFRLYQSSKGVLINVNFQVAVKSLDDGQWIPLDHLIQASIWKNYELVSIGCAIVKMPSPEDLFVITIAQCIFNMRLIPDWHRGYLYDLVKCCERDSLLVRLRLVFFKFAENLLSLVEQTSFDLIITNHFSFSDY